MKRRDMFKYYIQPEEIDNILLRYEESFQPDEDGVVRPAGKCQVCRHPERARINRGMLERKLAPQIVAHELRIDRIKVALHIQHHLLRYMSREARQEVFHIKSHAKARRRMPKFEKPSKDAMKIQLDWVLDNLLDIRELRINNLVLPVEYRETDALRGLEVTVIEIRKTLELLYSKYLPKPRAIGAGGISELEDDEDNLPEETKEALVKIRTKSLKGLFEQHAKPYNRKDYPNGDNRAEDREGGEEADETEGAVGPGGSAKDSNGGA